MPHAALLGPSSLLDACAPASDNGLLATRIDGPVTAAAIATTGADAVVAFAPSPADHTAIAAAELPTLLWWPDAVETATETAPTQRTIASSPGPGVWRNVGLPVSDAAFAAPASLSASASACAAWLGPPSARRAEYLSAFEHTPPILDEDDETPIAVNLHERFGPAWDHRAVAALARGRLLISEPLAPARGLEPGIDYVEGRLFEDIQLAVQNAVRAPDAFLRMRLRGRRKAELFRASRVIGRLVEDMLIELGARGR